MKIFSVGRRVGSQSDNVTDGQADGYNIGKAYRTIRERLVVVPQINKSRPKRKRDILCNGWKLISHLDHSKYITWTNYFLIIF